jgi:arylsulfatase A-like enzyme/tetratricopeptide (TPR) repeat protein
LLFLVSLAAPSSGAEPSSVLLITIDTLRADRLGAYGYAAAKTPHLDRLAEKGVLFLCAFTHCPVTLPSHATLLTGRLPYQHGVRSNSLYRLSDSETTLAETLKSAGYATAAFVSAAALDRRFGLDQGFDVYDDEMAPLGSGQLIAERDASSVTAKALGWLAEAGPRPFFLWVHYFDPHHPYAPPEPFRSDFSDAAYDGEIAYCDRHIGRLLETLETSNRLRNTVILVTADHGESLGEHGEETHGIFLYDATLRVPLIMSGPGVPHGIKDNRGPVGLVDLFPTTLSLLNLEGPPLPGRDLLAPAAGSPLLYAESYLPRDFYNWSELRALRSLEHKFIDAPRREFYDLRADPGETQNLAETRPRTVVQLASRLDRFVAEPTGRAPFEPDPGLLSQVQRLGYVGGSLPRELTERADAGRPDPKDRIGIVGAMDEAIGLFNRPDFAGAEKKLVAILGQDPDNFLAAHYLADSLFELERDEAVDAYRRAIEKGKDAAYYRYRLGLALERRGRFREAAIEWGRAVSMNPEAAAEMLTRAESLLERDEVDGVLAYLEKLKELGSRGAALELLHAEAWRRKGDEERALAAYELALPQLDRGAERLKVLKTVGALRGGQGALEEAERSFEEAVLIDPTDFEARANLALTRVRRGQEEAALDALAAALALRPDELRLLNLKAEIHYRRGEWNESRSLLLRSLAADKNQPRIIEALAEVEARLKN